MSSTDENENSPRYSEEEVLDNLIKTITQAKEEVTQYTPVIKTILGNLKSFLTDLPNPPQSWLDRLGKESSKYDYHQVVIPYDLRNPMLEDNENIELIETDLVESHCMALEYYLIDHNRFLWNDGHFDSVYSPKPLLLLDNVEPTEDVLWDCFLYIFPDGSFVSYNLENEDSPEEFIGANVFEELHQHYKVVSKLQIKFAGEHTDYGFIGSLQ